MLLQVIEKRHDQGRIDRFERQSRGRLVHSLLSELQELTERVAIGAYGVRTDPSLLHQTLCEEALQKWSEADGGAHGRSSQRRSSRDIASCINCGSALRYQKVSLQWTCPR